MANVTVSEVSKVYEGGVLAVNRLSLNVNDREFMVLVGPSGCGKSTMLRMIAGLEDVSDGTIRIGDRVVNNVPPKDRDIAMVFQNYALYPHMTVYENLAFGLKLRKIPKADIERRVRETAEIRRWSGHRIHGREKQHNPAKSSYFFLLIHPPAPCAGPQFLLPLRPHRRHPAALCCQEYSGHRDGRPARP